MYCATFHGTKRQKKSFVGTFLVLLSHSVPDKCININVIKFPESLIHFTKWPQHALISIVSLFILEYIELKLLKVTVPVDQS